MVFYKFLMKLDTLFLSICQMVTNGYFSNKILNPNYIASFFFTGAGIIAIAGIILGSMVSLFSLVWGVFLIPIILQSFHLSLLTNLLGKTQKETNTNEFIAVEEMARIIQFVLIVFVGIMIIISFDSCTFLYFMSFASYWIGMNFKACYFIEAAKEEKALPENPWI